MSFYLENAKAFLNDDYPKQELHITLASDKSVFSRLLASIKHDKV